LLHIRAIHQLQNIYQELTTDILKWQPPSIIYLPAATNPEAQIIWVS
jgi:hypothetical protein